MAPQEESGKRFKREPIQVTRPLATPERIRQGETEQVSTLASESEGFASQRTSPNRSRRRKRIRQDSPARWPPVTPPEQPPQEESEGTHGAS